MTDLAVRALTRADQAAWRDLWQGYLAFYEQDLPGAVTEELFERLLSPEGHRALVIEGADGIAGFVHYLFHDNTWSSGQSCYLEDLYVSPDARGGGAGRKLIAAVYAAADAEPGASGKVYWHTDKDNKRAQALYNRIGELTGDIRYNRPDKDGPWEEIT